MLANFYFIISNFLDRITYINWLLTPEYVDASKAVTGKEVSLFNHQRICCWKLGVSLLN
jgi:hypothetical protein